MNNIIDSNLKTEYFDCECSSAEHTLRFIYLEPHKIGGVECPAELYTEIHLNQYRNFFKRIWVAIKYVFGYKCQYGHWDVWTLNHNDCERLRDLVNKIIEMKKTQGRNN